MTPWDDLLDRVAADIAPHRGQGRVADYIPALAGIDARCFGIAVVDFDGGVHAVGDAAAPFSIQSVSKVLALTLGLNAVGDSLWRRVGREPAGTPFNSVVQLEYERGIPRNPFINAGALVVCDVLVSAFGARAAKGMILDLARRLSRDRDTVFDRTVAESERETAHRNIGLLALMKSFGAIENGIDTVLDVYVHQCALRMTCASLARAGLFLAGRGTDPLTGEAVTKPLFARRINALMMTCGHYDAAGDFAVTVGLPGKSGVGGGILAVVPGRASVAVWSPGLNAAGNSLVGTLALRSLITHGDLCIL